MVEVLRVGLKHAYMARKDDVVEARSKSKWMSKSKREEILGLECCTWKGGCHPAWLREPLFWALGRYAAFDEKCVQHVCLSENLDTRMGIHSASSTRVDSASASHSDCRQSQSM